MRAGLHAFGRPLRHTVIAGHPPDARARTLRADCVPTPLPTSPDPTENRKDRETWGGAIDAFLCSCYSITTQLCYSTDEEGSFIFEGASIAEDEFNQQQFPKNGGRLRGLASSIGLEALN